MKIIISLLFVIATTLKIEAQEIPVGSCGLIITYDAGGNRIKRQYFCNNGTTPYPTAIKKSEANEISEVQMVDALYPNPTSGKLYVTFSKALQNANVMVMDLSGKVVTRSKANGSRIEIDLSAHNPGTYLVNIEDGEMRISKKVIKL